jgi:protein O-GlcNAc transferase
MPRQTIQFAFAISQHRADRCHRVERLYLRILAREPDHAGALPLLGMLAPEEGSHELAACLISRAMRAEGLEACSSLGDALAGQGKTVQAIVCCVQALEGGWAGR